jgi:hypothetical protein
MGSYKHTALTRDDLLPDTVDAIFVDRFLATKMGADELERIFDIPNFPDLFLSKCKEFVALYQDEDSPPELADSSLHFLIMFFFENAERFRRYEIDLSFFENCMIECGVFQCVLDVFQSHREELLANSLWFLGLLSNIRQHFGALLSQGDFLPSLTDLVVNTEYGGDVTQMASCAFINLIEHYSAADATFSNVIPQVPAMNDSLRFYKLDMKFMPRILCQLVSYVDESDFAFFPMALTMLTNFVAPKTASTIGFCLYQMIRRCPEIVLQITKTRLLETLLALPADFPQTPMRPVFMAARVSLIQLTIMSETLDGFSDSPMRESILESIPWEVVQGALRSPEPAESTRALELVEAALPEAIGYLRKLVPGEWELIYLDLLPVFMQGTVDERVASLKLLSTLLAFSEMSRNALYDNEAFLDIAGDVLESGIGALQREMLNLFRNLLNGELEKFPKCALFAGNAWAHPIIGAGMGALQESEDEGVRVEVMLLTRRIERILHGI